MIPILVLAGPTASGKTELALKLAAQLKAELISADSRQVYIGLDIGTAKPSKAQLEQLRHHLIDIVDPRRRYNAGAFAKDAAQLIRKLHSEGKTPLVCGGTGFYIEALLHPLFDEPELPQEEREKLRLRLKEKAERLGTAYLHEELAAVDPETAARLHPNDFQRVSRALELYYLSGRTMHQLQVSSRREGDFSPLTVILDPPPERLKESIRRRCHRMIEEGWVQEVETLLASGLEPDAPGFESLGYREVIAVVQGRLSQGEALEEIIRKTWQFARRQRIWFKRRRAQLRADPQTLVPDEIVELWYSHCADAG